MSSSNKKKLGYKQYEKLLAQAHQKIEMIAQKVHEIQTYFIAYIEFNGDELKFNGWMNKRIEEMKAEAKDKENMNQYLNKEDRVNEKV